MPKDSIRTYWFFTTTQWSESAVVNLKRLFDSLINELARLGDDWQVRHVLLIQGVTSVKGFTFPSFVDVRYSESKISLASARNIMIKEWNASRYDVGLGSIYIGFPDDDAWFPEGSLSVIHSALTWSSPEVPFSFNGISRKLFVCAYGSKPEISAHESINFESESGLITFSKFASSNTCYFSLDKDTQLFEFDERLGVGARINGGEDLDYALRLLACAGGCYLLTRRSIIGHRDKLSGYVSNYYAGSLFACRKSARVGWNYRLLYLYKIFVGLYRSLRGQLKFSEWFRAITIQ